MLRWGVIGLGKIARTFAEEFAFISNAHIAYAAASNQEKAKAFAIEFKIPASGNYDELLASNEVDIVYIALPHSMHYDMTLKCLHAGKHVLCEKPITVNATQLDEIIRVARDKNLFVMEAMWSLFLPSLQKVHQWLNEGRIGPLVSMHAEFAFPAPNPGPSRLFLPELAGGSLLDIGIYPITACRYFLASLPSDFSISFLTSESGVDAAVSMDFEHRGALVHLYCSFLHRGVNSVFLYGANGYIEIPVFWKSKTCSLFDNGGNLIDYFKEDTPYHGFYHEISHVNDCISRGETESNIMPLSLSREIIGFMDRVRSKMDLTYPFE